MQTVDQIDSILATLNAAEVGSLESIGAKLRQVQEELVAIEADNLAESAALAQNALSRGDIAEFQRLRAFLQSRVGHLR
jgi:hypothetical protein